MKIREKFIGKTFGKLKVISNAGATPSGHLKWYCLCECGNNCTRTGTSLIRSKSSSCGCYSLHGKNNPLWKGYGDISSSWFDGKILRSANGSKGNRKVKEIDIDIKYLWELFLKQDKKCALTGLDLYFPKYSSNSSKGTASVDRIDSSKGYIKGNVQFVHKDINLMKNVFTQEHFIKMCKLVAGGSCEIE